MPYVTRSLTCDPAKIKGMSERLILSHYESNYEHSYHIDFGAKAASYVDAFVNAGCSSNVDRPISES